MTTAQNIPKFKVSSGKDSGFDIAEDNMDSDFRESIEISFKGKSQGFRLTLTPLQLFTSFHYGDKINMAKNTSNPKNTTKVGSVPIKVFEIADIQFEFAEIPAGTFQMGERDNSITVNFPYGYYCQTTTVTQELWRLVVEAHPKPSKMYGRDISADPSSFKNNPHYPVESVSYPDVEEYIARLNELWEEECARLGVECEWEFALPSEAQWEYACRAGTTTLFNNGRDDITQQEARFDSDSPCNVGSFPCNNWGLYDMHGNVWEWCKDEWHSDLTEMPEELRTNGNVAWTEDWEAELEAASIFYAGQEWENLYANPIDTAFSNLLDRLAPKVSK